MGERDVSEFEPRDPDDSRTPRRGRPRPGGAVDGRRRGPRQDQGDATDPYDYEELFVDAGAPPPPLKDRLLASGLRRYVPMVLGAIVVLWLVVVVRHQFDPAGPPGKEVTVQIKSGSSFSAVAGQLERAGVVPSGWALRMWAKVDGVPVVKAGEYTFHANSSDGQALRVMATGPKTPTDKLVIPEGLTLKQIAQRVGALPGMSAQRFLDLANGGTIRSQYEPGDVNSLEGLLFPDTYLLSSSDNERTLLQRMVNEFNSYASQLGVDQADQRVGHSPFETIIIASMIEAEAKVPDDRGKISQVINNRLFKAMPLQIDATVLYALGEHKSRVTNDDLKVRSPYNTYRVQGLPPGPICSPGKASIEAALNPTPGTWLYYVVTDPSTGAHSFATTEDEYRANLQRAREAGAL